jgi:hypothetical protein
MMTNHVAVAVYTSRSTNLCHAPNKASNAYIGSQYSTTQHYEGIQAVVLQCANTTAAAETAMYNVTQQLILSTQAIC